MPTGDRIYLADKETLDKNIEQTEKLYGNAIHPTVSGEIVTMNDSSDLALTGLKLYGKTTQDGEPSPDNPVPLVSVGDGGSIETVVSGQNLIPYPYVKESGYSVNGITFTMNDDGGIVANGTSTDNVYFHARDVLLAPGVYKASGCPSGGGASTFMMQFYRIKDDGTTGGVLKEFYTSGITITLTEAMRVRVYCTIRTSIVASNLTFYPSIVLASENDGVYRKGATAQILTTQTPTGLPGLPTAYTGNYIDANGQQWVCDEVDFARGVYVQRVYEKVLDGTKRVVVSNDYELSVSISTKAINSDNTVNGMCSHYKAVTRNVLINNRQTAGAMMFSVNAGYIRFLDNENYFQDAEGFTAMLADQYAAGTPVTIKYILATPIETPLSAEEIAAFKALHSNKPNTTVYNDSGAHMAVEYIADTKTYIDNKFTELQNAILSAGANI